jgi:hypothetical protein
MKIHDDLIDLFDSMIEVYNMNNAEPVPSELEEELRSIYNEHLLILEATWIL